MSALLLSTTPAVVDDSVGLKCKCKTILLNDGLEADEIRKEKEDLSLAPINVDLAKT